MHEFSVGSRTFRAGSLSTFDKLHVARKMAAALIFVGTMQLDDVKAGTALDAGAARKKYGIAMVAASANVDDANVDWSIGACLSVVSVKQAGGMWAPVRSPDGVLMFNDIDLPDLMQIVWEVIRTNGLFDFFVVAPSESNDGQTSVPR